VDVVVVLLVFFVDLLAGLVVDAVAEAGLAVPVEAVVVLAVVVFAVVVVLAEAFTGTAPGAEHLANLPEASRHFWPAVLAAAVGHLVNLPEASRHWAA
jgi:hypothetical protein